MEKTSGTCQVQGCLNKNEDKDIQISTKMSHVRVLAWHKVPSSAVVRHLWGQLIPGITSRSYVCSNHFTDGEPTANNPYPTQYLFELSAQKATQIIDKWTKEHQQEHKEFIEEFFHTMPKLSPIKRKSTQNGQVLATPTKRSKLMDSLSEEAKSTPGSDVMSNDVPLEILPNDKAQSVNPKITTEKKRPEENASSVVDPSLPTRCTGHTDSVSDMPRLEVPPELEEQGAYSVTQKRSPNKPIPELKPVTNELDEMEELLGKTLLSIQPNKEKMYKPIKNAEELKKKIINQSSGNPYVLLPRYPLPEWFDFRIHNFDDILTLPNSRKLLQKSDNKVPTSAKETVVPLKISDTVHVQISSKNVNDKVRSRPGPASSKPGNNNSVEVPGPSYIEIDDDKDDDDDVQVIMERVNTTKCEFCQLNLDQIKNISDQLKGVKTQIKMVIKSNREYIKRNLKLERELRVAQEHIKNLQNQNILLKATKAAAGNNSNQYVKTPDGRLFRVIPRQQQIVTNQAIMQVAQPLQVPTLIKPQPTLIGAAQPTGIIQAQTLQGQVPNIQQPAAVAPGNIVLRIGELPGRNGGVGLQVMPSTGVSTQQVAGLPTQQVITNLGQLQTVTSVQNVSGQQSISLMSQALNSVKPVVSQVNGQCSVISNGVTHVPSRKPKTTPPTVKKLMDKSSVDLSTSNCTVCPFLARELQRLKKRNANLRTEFDILDKVNTTVIDMFTPASSAFCALLGMEMIIK